MSYLLFIGAAICAIVLYRRLRECRRMMLHLADAIRDKRTFLLESKAQYKTLEWIHLQEAFNDLLDKHQEMERDSASELQQIETTLGQLQEAVLMVDQTGNILMINRAATELLDMPTNPTSERIHQFIKSSDMLDYITHIQEGGAQARREVSILKEGKTFWFEISGIAISTQTASNTTQKTRQTNTYLFVFHNITRLKNLENMRREFVANVSHELRTPVTIIKGFTDTLLNDHSHLSHEDREKFLKKIHRNVERFHELLEDLLSLSRLESDRITLNRQEIDIVQLIEDVHDQFKHRLQPDQTITLELDPSASSIWVDELKFSQILNNLLDNAVRYAKDFTTIRIRTKLEGRMLWFSVIDDGKTGIPQKDLPHLFERFYRVDKGRSREFGGTGLGLSIAKHIVLMHGGDIRAESVEGQGTSIHFSIPIRHPRETDSLTRSWA